MVVRTKLKKGDFKKILRNYDIGHYISHKHLEDTLENDVYILRTKKGKFILKVLKNVNLKSFSEQLELIDFLYKNKIPVVKNTKDKKSNEIIKYQKNRLIIQEFIEGIHPKKINKKLLKDIAYNIAKMHLALLNSKFKIKIKSVHVYKKRNLEKCPNGECLESIQNSLIKNLNKFKNKKLKVTRIHSDISEVNVLIKNNKLKAFIDFDDSDYDYIVYEIAIFIAHTLIRSNKIHKDKIKLFLKEYQKQIKLNNDEKQLTYFLIKYRLFGILYWYVKYTKLHPERTKQFKRGIERSIARIEKFEELSLEDFLKLF